MVFYQTGGDTVVHHAAARSALLVTLILLSASADGDVSYAESPTPPLLRADLAFTGANGGRQAGEALPSVRDLTDVSVEVCVGGGGRRKLHFPS